MASAYDHIAELLLMNGKNTLNEATVIILINESFITFLVAHAFIDLVISFKLYHLHRTIDYKCLKHLLQLMQHS